jgi:hypothetical protein
MRWLLADPDRVKGWVHPVLFSDPELEVAVAVFAEHGELHASIDACEANDLPELASLFRRLAVTAPTTEDFDDALAIVVGNAVDRVVDAIDTQRDLAEPQELAAIGNLKHLQLNLRESHLRVDALAQLVPWLSEWDEHRQEKNLR